MGEIRAKQEEKIGQRKLQINPFEKNVDDDVTQAKGVCACESLWNVDDDVTQAMSKGGGACECPSVGVLCFSNFGRVDDVTRAMSKGGGCLWLSV